MCSGVDVKTFRSAASWPPREARWFGISIATAAADPLVPAISNTRINGAIKLCIAGAENCVAASRPMSSASS